MSISPFSMGQSIEWNQRIPSPQPESEPKPWCDAEMQIPEDSFLLLAQLTDGILLGGYILIIIFSLCGNTAALIIVLKSKAPRMSTKYFLICLVISDMIMTGTAPPINIGGIMAEYNAWIFGAFMCKLVPCLQITAATMSAMCLMAIAIERNLLIVQTMSSTASRLHRLWGKWVCPVISVCIIIVPIVCGIPDLWGYEHVSFTIIPPTRPSTSPGTSEVPPPEEDFSTTGEDVASSSSPGGTTSASSRSCKISYYCMRTTFDRRNIIYYGVTGGTYFFLLICFLLCYISIYRFVQKHGEYWKKLRVRQYSISSGTGHSIHHTPPSQEDSKLMAGARHRKTLKLILVLILLHLLLRMPNWIMIVVLNVKYVEETITIATLREFLKLLSAVNSALNPFLYVIWNHSLRATADRTGLAGTNRKRHTSCLWRTRKCCLQRLHHIFHSIRSCCRYKKKRMDDSSQNPEPLGYSSYIWLWKTPKVYHISGSTGLTSSNQHQNNMEMTQSHSTQPVYVSTDKSHL